MNAWHRIVNASSAPALLLAGTTAPNLLNLINNVDVMFNCPYEFRDRFSGADDFYKYKDDIEPDPVRGLAMRRTNFIPDVVNCDLPLDNRRSPGWRRVEPFMTGNTFYLWIGQHENGRYSKAHAHTSAAVLICLKGKGYTYTWPERYGVTPWKDGHADKIKRVDYEPVGMVSAAPGGARWYHQHFGASKDRCGSPPGSGRTIPAASPARPARSTPTTPAMDIPEGGTAIPYWMEDPFIAPGIRGQAQGRGRARAGWSPNSTRRAPWCRNSSALDGWHQGCHLDHGRRTNSVRSHPRWERVGVRGFDAYQRPQRLTAPLSLWERELTEFDARPAVTFDIRRTPA